jgi:glycosyltransferase involved in cell wall biosynthesis
MTVNLVHLTASTLYGGPERQMLGLARALPQEEETFFLSFSEGGRCRPFLAAARREGFQAAELTHDTPYFRSAIREIADHLVRWQASALFCHGYKADLLGRKAARRVGIPVVGVSRGWTGETWRVRLYEALDRLCLRWMDRVVCVSAAQAARVRRGGVKAAKVLVIPNAVDPERFTDPDPSCRRRLERYFRGQRARIVGAAGRLSPEKGFATLIDAAAAVVQADPSVGFVLFGSGPCRAALTEQIREAGLTGSVVLAGFRTDLDRFLPHLDLFVLPSFTEGMPNVILEAFAAAVPVVATAVGGTPELVEDEQTGFLVPPGDATALASRILDALVSPERMRELTLTGRDRVLEHHTFPAQAARYLQLLDELVAPAGEHQEETPAPEPASSPETLEQARQDEPGQQDATTPTRAGFPLSEPRTEFAQRTE